MTKTKLMFWISTGIIFIMEGVLVAFTSQSEMSINGFTSLGYPAYFVSIVAVFKVLGSLVLIVPKISSQVKEWAYAGFAIDFISAFISILVVTKAFAMALFPLVFIVLLIISYTSYRKLRGMPVIA
jgi:hypothetical protein